MSPVCAPALPSPPAVACAALLNEGLNPGVRVMLDERPDETATVCFAETDAAYTHVRLDRTGQRLRLASWRLACLV